MCRDFWHIFFRCYQSQNGKTQVEIACLAHEQTGFSIFHRQKLRISTIIIIFGEKNLTQNHYGILQENQVHAGHRDA